MTKLHPAGKAHLKNLIESGDYDASEDTWDFSAADGDALLGKDGKDWPRFAGVHLGEANEGDAETKGHWKYPAAKANGDGDEVHRAGLIAAKKRAAQQGDKEIESASGSLIDMIDAKEAKKKKANAPAILRAAALDSPSLLAEFITLAGTGVVALDPESVRTGRSAGAQPPRPAGGGVALLSITGPLAARGYDSFFFGSIYGYDSLCASLAAALNNDQVGTIVLDFDSPGGVVDGCPECAAAIAAVAAEKTVIAVANTTMCSAAYWLGSQASELVVSPSGSIGSIGVMSMHRDLSGACEQAGIRVSLVSAPQDGYKTEFSPFAPLSDGARATLQVSCDDAYAQFIADVASGREVKSDKVMSDFGRGRKVAAAQAVASGMADRIASLDDVLNELLGSAMPGAATRMKRRSTAAFR